MNSTSFLCCFFIWKIRLYKYRKY